MAIENSKNVINNHAFDIAYIPFGHFGTVSSRDKQGRSSALPLDSRLLRKRQTSGVGVSDKCYPSFCHYGRYR